VSDNGWGKKAFLRDQKFLHPVGGDNLAMGLRGRRHFGGVTIRRAKKQCQQQYARNKPFERVFDDKGWNTHGAIVLRLQNDQIGGLPLSALENALTIKRTRNTIKRSLAMDAASPASPKKPI
jgi:hypothetical protein